MDLDSDSDLLDLLRQGDREAWLAFVTTHGPWLLSTARRSAGNEADAEDLVNEVFATFHDQLKRGKLEHHRGITRWLSNLLRGIFSDLIVRKLYGQRRRSNVKVLHRPELPDLTGRDDDPFIVAEKNEQLELITQAIADLPTQERQVVAKYYLQQQSLAAIAAELDVTIDTVKGRLAKARITLRRLLASLLDQDTL
jgi:RNA polymerase sigma factor (sigma-70 family)